MVRDIMIVAGFGFREGAGAESLRDALDATGVTPDLLATLPEKAGHPAMTTLAARLGLAVQAAAPDGQATVTRSNAAMAAYGTGSVAEAAALAAAGPTARLLGPRVISHDRMATCAIAEGDPE